MDLSCVGQRRRRRQPYSLVVCEKPAAALRIAQVLGSASLRKISRLDNQNQEESKKTGNRLLTPVFHATSVNGMQFIICSAIGHLYELADPKNDRNSYPVFDVKWVPVLRKSGKIGRQAKSASIISEQIISTIATLSRRASSFIHACDYDQEGELIGYNILEYACNRKYEKSLRAKFSTLTDEEIRNSFDQLLKPNSGLAEAGKTRHVIDFIYGINLSRALTQSYKHSNNGKRYSNLSIGRVQGPTLSFIVDREIEIRKHVPIPYWHIYGEFKRNGHLIEAQYYPHKVRTLSEAKSIVEACRGQNGKIIEVKSQKISRKAPAAFNLGDLQREAYRVFSFSPSYTLKIAEKLYLGALISYPRTSSQKIPPSIDYRKIIVGISKIGSALTYGADGKKKGTEDNHQSSYRSLAMNLLSKSSLCPVQGSKTDPAHPAIYPTGERPRGNLETPEVKIFDLIIKRFFATFGDPALMQLTSITIEVDMGYLFKSDTRRTVYQGWMLYYKPYISTINPNSDNRLLDLHNGDVLENIDITSDEKFSQPPSRFNQATLLEQMEKDNIGTKATRSEIISTLFKRNYISSSNDIGSYSYYNINNRQRHYSAQAIEATDIGFEIIQSMRKYIPEIVSKDLTRSTEEQLEEIESGRMKSTVVLENSINKLKQAAACFKENEIDLGEQITEAVMITRDRQWRQQQEAAILDSCPICDNGWLKITRSAKTKKRFMSCSNYMSGKCKATAPLPQSGSIQSTGKRCNLCKWPILKTTYINHGSHPWRFCSNSHCPSKK